MRVEEVRRALLEARDARAEALSRTVAARGAASSGCYVFVSVNVPGPDKDVAALDGLFADARTTVAGFPGGLVADEGRDALGPWAIVASTLEAVEAKHRCVALEEGLPLGRLADLDVYNHAGDQIDRRSLGLPSRRCLVCDEAAASCIRAARHPIDVVVSALHRLLREHGDTRSHASQAPPASALATALVDAARIELDLTPKPGLVDRLDSGSHPDLTYDDMQRSIALLPRYYEELLAAARQTAVGPPSCGSEALDACIEAGRRAEERMIAQAGSNTHRGYIFLSGLVLLAACARPHGATAFRACIGALASRILARPRDEGRKAAAEVRKAEGGRAARLERPGAGVRRQLGLSGIHGEAVEGLPSVFDHGLPALESSLARFGDADVAHHYVMATLMTAVEDTTAVHRCGPAGLDRLRADGARLRALIDSGRDYRAWLSDVNDEYRAMRLTMGGVADCLAITIGLRLAGRGNPQNLNPTDTGT